MNLTAKIVLPAAVYALVLAGAFAWGGAPALVSQASHGAALLAGLVPMLAVIAVTVEFTVRRPLAALARLGEAAAQPAAAPVAAADAAFRRIERAIHGLQQTAAAQRAELCAADERCERAERALALSEERLAIAVRGAHDGLWERDLDNARLILSPRWKSLLGYADDEFPNAIEAWREHVHPDDRDGAEAALAAHLEGATPRYERQLRLLHKDGRYRWMLSRGSAVRHANGRAYRIIGLDTDITAIKRVEYVLQQVVEGTAGTYGEDFFRCLVRHFAAALEVSCAFITECTDQPPTRVRTLAFWSASSFLDSLEYELAGTPCEAVIHEARTCFHPCGLARKFPVEGPFESYIGIPIIGREGKVLGHLAFLDSKEMGAEMLLDAVFRIFATRAAAELERRAMLERLAPRLA
ncbi:PAS domain-containing protein [Aromatoleum anaerobium]|uniref:histidine kinase n=1 Tax=Aromatoleum anaerobium TaxID=182180 RepID=A0ABX1PK36_9RHOO|nr:PAS domain-containing protein [Aromatoleum anaerobium]MCK0509436.1 PAS domain-containing protein [Aromatoleum anaerobium]